MDEAQQQNCNGHSVLNCMGSAASHKGEWLIALISFFLTIQWQMLEEVLDVPFNVQCE